jgi:hypothetical protein
MAPYCEDEEENANESVITNVFWSQRRGSLFFNLVPGIALSQLRPGIIARERESPRAPTRVTRQGREHPGICKPFSMQQAVTKDYGALPMHGIAG